MYTSVRQVSFGEPLFVSVRCFGDRMQAEFGMVDDHCKYWMLRSGCNLQVTGVGDGAGRSREMEERGTGLVALLAHKLVDLMLHRLQQTGAEDQ